VEFEPGATPGLFAMEELRAELSVLAAGRDVDLVTPAALHPLLRERVLAQAVEQYAA
jgi:predicted nucleotidyltransferase